MQRVLQHQIKKGLKYPIGAFDIETDGLFGTYLDGYVKYADDPTFYRCRTLAELWQQIIKRPNVILYAHNFKGYESSYLIDVLPTDQKIELIIQGDGDVIGMILDMGDEGKIELRDSYALIPMSLGKAALAFKTRTQKGDIGLKQGEIYDPTNVVHQEYCKDDVQATIEIVEKAIELQGEIFGCGIGWTAASSAMAAWKTTIPKGHAYHRLGKAQELFCREGYYGGFVFPGHSIERNADVISIDRNAAYAACMRGEFPIGRGLFTLDYEEGYLGMYEVKVKNEERFPVLPLRQDGNLLWPQGEYTTIVTSEEVAYARSIGIEVEVIEGIYWEKSEQPFLDFVDSCEQIETTEPGKKPMIKLNRNSLYGKFGSKLEVLEAKISEEDLIDWIPYVDKNTGRLNLKLWYQLRDNDADYILPHWAAFVTARERIWLFQTIHTIGVDYVHYCDTDSVKADGWRVRECQDAGLLDIHESRYGACKVDEEYAWFQCLGSKVYHGELKSGERKQRAKGIPMCYLSTKLFDDAYTGIYEKVKIEHSGHSTLSRLKRGLPLSQDIGRQMTDRTQSKSWDFREDGSIHPIVIK